MSPRRRVSPGTRRRVPPAQPLTRTQALVVWLAVLFAVYLLLY